MQVIPIDHIGRLYEHKINIILINLMSTMGMLHPKELISEVKPLPKETSTAKVNKIYYKIRFSFL